jgi:hypothetical protein
MHHRNIFVEHTLLGAPQKIFLPIRVFLVVPYFRKFKVMSKFEYQIPLPDLHQFRHRKFKYDHFGS